MESTSKPSRPTIPMLLEDLRNLHSSLSTRPISSRMKRIMKQDPQLRERAQRSDPWIVFVSTPNKPGGFIESFLNEPESKYYKLKLDYRTGLGKIYTDDEIAEAKLDSTSFDREYDLKFLGYVGTCFSQLKIDNCVAEATYDPDAINPYALRSLGIDPGYGQLTIWYHSQ